MGRQRRKGFTLVELMIVAIIVAVLAAVAVPLMLGNKQKAIASEGQAGCSVIRTAVQVYLTEGATLPPASSGAGIMTTFAGIEPGDLDGAYFGQNSYSYAPGAGGGFTITATALARSGYGGETVIMNVGSDRSTTWTGTLL